jgi:DNA-binding response OmpR family regulator
MIHDIEVSPEPPTELPRTQNRGSILIVEDDPRMQRVLSRVFSNEQYSTVVAGDGQLALDLFFRARPHAVVLDLILPQISGRELCQKFKNHSSETPVVVLSGITEVADKVLLLELGADDYVTKPFSPRELTARVEAAIRRQHKPTLHSIYRFANYEIDFQKMTVLCGGINIVLTALEFKLLKFFAENEERVLTRDVLLNEVWGMNLYPTNRTVDNQMLKLRQKLEHDPANPKHLLTVYGAGYKFVP